MTVDDPSSAREEAERLVASVLAAARLAAGGAGHGGWASFGAGPVGSLLADVLGGAGAAPDGDRIATGGPDCCVCPLCRAISAIRDPNPEFAERLATGAGDLAAGVASLLRAFAPTAGQGGSGGSTAGQGGSDGPITEDRLAEDRPGDGRDVWAAATATGTATSSGDGGGDAPSTGRKRAGDPGAVQP